MESNPFVKYSKGYVMTTALSVIILTHKNENVYICAYEKVAKCLIFETMKNIIRMFDNLKIAHICS
jgi:hypothetical protein